MKRYRQENPERVKAWKKKYRQNLFHKVLELYGTVCDCCGEKNEQFLSLDHRRGGGSKHRKLVGDNVDAVYRDILKQEYNPWVYRILCFNCNLGRERNNGICPHIIDEFIEMEVFLKNKGYI